MSNAIIDGYHLRNSDQSDESADASAEASPRMVTYSTVTIEDSKSEDEGEEVEESSDADSNNNTDELISEPANTLEATASTEEAEETSGKEVSTDAKKEEDPVADEDNN